MFWIPVLSCFSLGDHMGYLDAEHACSNFSSVQKSAVRHRYWDRLGHFGVHTTDRFYMGSGVRNLWTQMSRKFIVLIFLRYINIFFRCSTTLNISLYFSATFRIFLYPNFVASVPQNIAIFLKGKLAGPGWFPGSQCRPLRRQRKLVTLDQEVFSGL